jgi:hypothetical protein
LGRSIDSHHYVYKLSNISSMDESLEIWVREQVP